MEPRMNEKRRLQILDTNIALPSIESVNLFVFNEFIKLQFLGIPEAQRTQNFHLNPVNTLLYRALEAKANQDLVHVIEHIRTEESMFSNLKTKIKGKWNLVMHRNVISHPATTTWTDHNTQTFYANHQHYFLNKAFEVWKVKRSIEKGLVKHLGNTNNPISVQARIEFTEFFIYIMSKSLNPHIALPPHASIQNSLNIFFADYNTNLLAQF